MKSRAVTIHDEIRRNAALIEAAGLCYGHGTDNAFDEAAELVFFAAGLRHEDAPDAYQADMSADAQARVRVLIQRRIKERIPTAYLTRRMWFCGHEFYVDERVLVPRSPIAELIETEFAPWLESASVDRMLDIGTGSGCIAVAAALALPAAHVDASDISADALNVARLNIDRHSVGSRVRPIRSDVFSALTGERYDLILSNPPYVAAAEVAVLPEEYRHEPQLGLLAGVDGLCVVRRILAGAHEHLTPRGVLIVEVGDSQNALVDSYPRVPFTWLEFERGGGGVFLLTAEEVNACHAELTAT